MSDGKEGATSQVPARRQVFRREGEYWTVVYEAATFRLRDLKGLRHIACLLRHPQTEICATELDGRERKVPATAESEKAAELARVNVTRAISIALKRIAAHHPELGQHLKNTVATGRMCAYRPDTRLPIEWES